MHDHHCAHVLAYCGSCDVAYCKKCSREWGKYTNWYYPQYTTTTYPDSINVTTSGTTLTQNVPTAHSQGHHPG